MTDARPGAGSGRVAFMPEPGRVELLEYPLPEVAPGAMLLRVEAAGVCGSEIHMFRGDHPVLRSVILGHELVGEIVALGAGVDADSAGVPLRIGDLVTPTYYRSCRHCDACGRGELGACEHGLERWLQRPEELPHFVGTMSTHYYVDPDQWVFKLPASVPARAAAAANCALAQMVNAVEQAELRPGASLVVQGVGGLGLYAIGLARERSARVIAIDGSPLRLERALQFGADAVIDISRTESFEERRAEVQELLGAEGADVVIDAAGSTEAFVEGIGLTRSGGRLVEVGMVLTGQTVSFDLGSATRRAITIVPVVRYEPRHLKLALEFLERNVGRLPLEQVIDGVYGLDQVEQAIADSAARKVTRAAVVPDPAPR